MDSFARYLVSSDTDQTEVRFSRKPAVVDGYSDFEKTLIYDFIRNWCIERGYGGAVGYSIDPYELFLEYLRGRFDDAEIVERHYSWTPNVMYGPPRVCTGSRL